LNHSFNIEAALGYHRKRQINVSRIESDKFKICEPTIVRAQKYVVSEQTWIVHVPKKGRIRAKLLK
jgi:hypothetical protein